MSVKLENKMNSIITETMPLFEEVELIQLILNKLTLVKVPFNFESLLSQNNINEKYINKYRFKSFISSQSELIDEIENFNFKEANKNRVSENVLNNFRDEFVDVQNKTINIYNNMELQMFCDYILVRLLMGILSDTERFRLKPNENNYINVRLSILSILDSRFEDPNSIYNLNFMLLRAGIKFSKKEVLLCKLILNYFEFLYNNALIEIDDMYDRIKDLKVNKNEDINVNELQEKVQNNIFFDKVLKPCSINLFPDDDFKKILESYLTNLTDILYGHPLDYKPVVFTSNLREESLKIKFDDKEVDSNLDLYKEAKNLNLYAYNENRNNNNNKDFLNSLKEDFTIDIKIDENSNSLSFVIPAINYALYEKIYKAILNYYKSNSIVEIELFIKFIDITIDKNKKYSDSDIYYENIFLYSDGKNTYVIKIQNKNVEKLDNTKLNMEECFDFFNKLYQRKVNQGKPKEIKYNYIEREVYDIVNNTLYLPNDLVEDDSISLYYKIYLSVVDDFFKVIFNSKEKEFGKNSEKMKEYFQNLLKNREFMNLVVISSQIIWYNILKLEKKLVSLKEYTYVIDDRYKAFILSYSLTNIYKFLNIKLD